MNSTDIAQRERAYFLILDYLSSEQSLFDKTLLRQILSFVEQKQLLPPLLSLKSDTLSSSTFKETQFENRRKVAEPPSNERLLPRDNLESILTYLQAESAKNIQTIASGFIHRSARVEKLASIHSTLSNQAANIAPTREIFKKSNNRRSRNCASQNLSDFFSTSILSRFQHLKTCFGHAYSAESGSVNEESGEPYIPIYNVVFDKSGRLIVTADEEGLIKVWSSDNGLLLSNLKGHTSSILSNDISPCNRFLVTCSIDFTARVWDLVKQTCILAIKSDEQLNAVLFYKKKDNSLPNTTTSSSNEQPLFLIVMTSLGNISIYREDQFTGGDGGMKDSLTPAIQLTVRRGKRVADQGKDGGNESVCIETHPDGYLVVGSEAGDVMVWDKIHTMVQRNNRPYHPMIEKREHTKNCQLIKFSPDGKFMVTASFDGFAKVWPWQKLLDNDPQLPDLIISLYFDNSNKCEKNCWNVSFSCGSRYVFATFTRKIKRSSEVESVVYVYNLPERRFQSQFTRQNAPVKLQDHILVFEPHPKHENILLTADYSGQIIIYDVEVGAILNVFQERGYHIGYPNFEVPVLDGCWSPDGLRFVVSTYFGSFSLYGYDSLDLYRTTPTEQFFANDTDIFIFSESLVPLSVDDDEVQINSKKRGKICDYQRIPYRFEFPNSFESLKSKGFLDEQIGEDYIAEDKRLTVEERKRIALKETNKAFLEKCDGIREHLLAKNQSVEGTMRVHEAERQDILKRMAAIIVKESPQFEAPKRTNTTREEGDTNVRAAATANAGASTSNSHFDSPRTYDPNAQRGAAPPSTNSNRYNDDMNARRRDAQRGGNNYQQRSQPSRGNHGDIRNQSIHEEDWEESASDPRRGNFEERVFDQSEEEDDEDLEVLRSSARRSLRSHDSRRMPPNSRSGSRAAAPVSRNTRSSSALPQTIPPLFNQLRRSASSTRNNNNFMRTRSSGGGGRQTVQIEDEDEEEEDEGRTIVDTRPQQVNRERVHRMATSKIVDSDEEELQHDAIANEDKAEDEAEDDVEYQEAAAEETEKKRLKKSREDLQQMQQQQHQHLQQQQSLSRNRNSRSRGSATMKADEDQSSFDEECEFDEEEDDDADELDDDNDESSFSQPFRNGRSSQQKKRRTQTLTQRAAAAATTSARRRIASDDDEDEEEDEEDEEYSQSAKKRQQSQRSRSSRGAQQQEQQLNNNSLNSKRSARGTTTQAVESLNEGEHPVTKRFKGQIDSEDQDNRHKRLASNKSSSQCERCGEGDDQKRHLVEKCEICQGVYHEQCGRLRGCFRDRHFFCFDCYAHNNFSRSNRFEEDKREFSREYLQALDDKNPYRYLPQIGDSVYYEYKAHEEFCARYFGIFDYQVLVARMGKKSLEAMQGTGAAANELGGSSNSYYERKAMEMMKIDYKMLPFLEHPVLQQRTLCRVKDVEFVMPMLATKKLQEKHKDRPIFMLLTLDVIDSNLSFKCYFANSVSHSEALFLIPKDLFDEAKKYENTLATSMNSDQTITFFFRGYNIPATVIEVSPAETYVQESDYNRILVKVLDDSMLSKMKNLPPSFVNYTLRISCWDVILDEYSPERPLESFISSESSRQQLLKLLIIMKSELKEELAFFLHPVDLQAYGDYVQFVELPMDFSMIEKRISLQFYRSLESVCLDARLIASNSFKYNDAKGEVCRLATISSNILCSVLQTFPDIQQCLSFILKNKKNINTVIETYFPIKETAFITTETPLDLYPQHNEKPESAITCGYAVHKQVNQKTVAFPYETYRIHSSVDPSQLINSFVPNNPQIYQAPLAQLDLPPTASQLRSTRSPAVVSSSTSTAISITPVQINSSNSTSNVRALLESQNTQQSINLPLVQQPQQLPQPQQGLRTTRSGRTSRNVTKFESN